MTTGIRLFCAAVCTWVAALTVAADAPADKAESPTYTLHYQFHAGETLRWEVLHQTAVRTSVSGATQVAETVSTSTKAWRVKDVTPDGTATFEHVVENVDMRQKLGGRDPLRYNSQTDKKPPHGFENVAESIGVPLSVITLDAHGKIIKRERKALKGAAKSEAQMTLPLPAEPVPVGHTWSLPQDIDVPVADGLSRKVKVVQRFTLEGVQTGVATIRVDCQVLTPISDPSLESQLLPWYSSGTVRFDVDAGRVLSQQVDVDRRVVGFRGEVSSLHYVTRFTETFLSVAPQVASRPAPDAKK